MHEEGHFASGCADFAHLGKRNASPDASGKKQALWTPAVPSLRPIGYSRYSGIVTLAPSPSIHICDRLNELLQQSNVGPIIQITAPSFLDEQACFAQYLQALDTLAEASAEALASSPAETPALYKLQEVARSEWSKSSMPQVLEVCSPGKSVV
jgi:hypothetical protein